MDGHQAVQYLGRIGAGLVLVLVTSGCGVPGTSGGVAVGKRFTAAVSASEWDRACSLLAPETTAELEKSAGKGCPAALAEESPPEPGPLVGWSAFGTMTQLRFEEDTMFVARFRSGWRVVALECAPVPGHPYDCGIEGG
jgi:hypothetical protein